MLLTTLLVTLIAAPDTEVARIQEHLRGASALLLERDVSPLTEAQRARRTVNAERLAAYTAAGRFPKNHRVPGLNPIFRDDDGTLCAVGALLWASGERALVERIVATRNTATVQELADEPGLAAWLDAQALTLAEAARIQPGYAFEAFSVTTPSYSVPAGACSPPVQLEPAPNTGTDQKTNVRAWSTPTRVWDATFELFEGAQCQTLLVPSCPNCSLYLSTATTLSFRRSEPGQLTLQFVNGSGSFTQVHEILLPDGGVLDGGEPDAGDVQPDAGVESPLPPVGCGCEGGGSASLLASALLLLAGRRQSAAGRHSSRAHKSA